MLVSSHYSELPVSDRTQPTTTLCGQCSYCPFLDTRTHAILPGGFRWKARHSITCMTRGIVYPLQCPCGLYYIGTIVLMPANRRALMTHCLLNCFSRLLCIYTFPPLPNRSFLPTSSLLLTLLSVHSGSWIQFTIKWFPFSWVWGNVLFYFHNILLNYIFLLFIPFQLRRVFQRAHGPLWSPDPCHIHSATGWL